MSLNATERQVRSQELPFETQDFGFRYTLITFLVAMSMALVSGALAELLIRATGPLEIIRWRSTLEATRTPPEPAPKIQNDERAELLAFRARERLELQSYGWIDKEHGIVRIPIERAKDLILKRGLLKSRPAAEGKPQ